MLPESVTSPAGVRETGSKRRTRAARMAHTRIRDERSHDPACVRRRKSWRHTRGAAWRETTTRTGRIFIRHWRRRNAATVADQRARSSLSPQSPPPPPPPSSARYVSLYRLRPNSPSDATLVIFLTCALSPNAPACTHPPYTRVAGAGGWEMGTGTDTPSRGVKQNRHFSAPRGDYARVGNNRVSAFQKLSMYMSRALK